MKPFSAYSLYLAMRLIHGLAFMTYATYSIVYMVTVVGLNPFQLVFVGTVLEVSFFLLEIPTGVVADVYSRRLSILVGYLLVGVGFALTGVTTSYGVILISQVIWGGGYTFLSGAIEAWIADELIHSGDVLEGEHRAGTTARLTLSQVYLRGSQLYNIGSLIGIGIGALLAQIGIAWPLLVGGALFLLLALGVALFMPEAGFTRTPAAERESWGQLFAVAQRGLRVVRGQPVLLTMLVITAFVGAWSESFDRLWTKHLIDNFVLPALGGLDWVVWFGIIQAVGMVLALGLAEWLRRYVDTTMPRRLIGALMAMNGLLFLGALFFAGAGNFVMALSAFWLVEAMRAGVQPLFAGWINQFVDSKIRATVLSIHGQSDAIGQVVGGPLIGLLGTWTTLRTALRFGTLLLLPAIGLYAQLFRTQPMIATGEKLS